MKNIVSKISNTPVAVKASVAFLGGSIVSKAMVYFTIPIYTRLMNADEFGQSSVYYTWQNVLGIFAMFCLSMGIFNNGMANYPNKRDEYSYSLLALSQTCTFFFIGFFAIIYPFASDWVAMPIPLLVLMGITFLTQPAYRFWMVRQRYEYKYKSLLVWTIVMAFASPLTAVTCLLLFPQNSLYARLFGAEGSQIAIYIYFVFFIAYKSKFRITTKYWKEALLFNLPLIPHYLSVLVLGSSDRIMISKLVGDSEAAYYTVAYNISIAMTVVWTAINSSLIPYTYEKCKVHDYKSISKIVNILLVAFACIVFLFSLFAPEAIIIMAPDNYMDALFVVPPIVCSVFFQVQYFVYANIVYYFKKPAYLMGGSILAASLNIALNYWLIPIWGYYVAGYTTLFCYILQAIIDFVAMKTAVGFSIYNTRFILQLSLVAIIFIMLVGQLYSYTTLRVALFCVCLIILIYYRKSFKDYYFILKNK